MKKALIVALALALVLVFAAGCGGNGNNADNSADDGAKKGIDALPADSAAAADDDFGDLGLSGDLRSLVADDGFAGKSADGANTAPVHDDWVTVSDSE